MATQTFHSKIAAQPGTASTEVIVKSQHDTDIASAKARANHTGTQASSTISDFNTAVDARVALIVDAAPSTLDTLNELAAALGDDPNFAATIAGQIGDLDERVDTLEAESGGGAGGYAANVGDAALSTFTVTHSLGTLDVGVEVVQISNGQTVYPVVTRTSTSAVSVDFGSTVPASNSHRVLVRKVV